ncbi:ABC transporter ATP-binding protein [Nocardia camponoti]|uniref:ABC transporter ATP-binding protein n=1 Tax=Nocardia camponoti TaxID=1616106 RepID=UPI0016667201|nr:ABC transporter ATP-binding protein [Nocardia camponoti]
MSIDALLRVSRGRFNLDLPLSVEPGEVVALLGPNGAGKSTALRALAGLTPLTDGHLRVGNRDGVRKPAGSRDEAVTNDAGRTRQLSDGEPDVAAPDRTSSWGAENSVVARNGRAGAWDTSVDSSEGAAPLHTVDWDVPPGIFVAPEDRSVGVVFQDYLLFAHMSALENVAFGPRARGVGRREARALAASWLERVGLGDELSRKPRQLSGGQAQRVALARALATDPELLLLDEPLAALDAGTRLHVRAELGKHLREYGGHTVLVTHDPLDAMVLADRLVILENGKVVQEGAPAEVARHPRTDYVADLVGLNLYRGAARDTTVELSRGGTLFIAEPAAGAVYATFAPNAVGLYLERPEGSPRNTWETTVVGMETHAHTTRVRLDGTPPVLAEVTPATVADLRLTPGMKVWATVKATEIRAYPA